MWFSTKVLICIAGVLGNASIWGDASIDTVLADTYGYTNTKVTDSKSCARLCKFGQKPRRCTYDFRVTNEYIDNRTVLAINGQTPGPAIQVCLNDIVVVNVVNRLQGTELAFHWRGVNQRGSSFMDGAPMVTQCPIISGTSFRYAFRADEMGTHLYHAHSVSQQLHGLFGSFVVKLPSPLEPAASLYDHDRSADDILMISAGTSKFGSNKPTDLIIDGHYDNSSSYRRLIVLEGSRYRIRTINAIPLDCPVTFKIHDHRLIIISSDGRAVKPVSVESYILYPGERIDFVLDAIQIPSTYKIHVKGLSHCDGLEQFGLVTYENTNITYTKTSNNQDDTPFYTRPISGQDLIALSGPPAHLTVSPFSEKSVYLQLDSNSIKVDDDDNEYRYLSDAMPVPAFYPAELTVTDEFRKVIQINGKSFMYPNSPILSQPNDVLDRTICNVGAESRNKYMECVQVLNVEYKSTLELIIVDEGFGSETNKTFHIHGNPMYVLKTSESNVNPITVQDVQNWDKNGNIERNLLNPPRKDTVMVPNKGYVIVRIVADNPGAWLFECPACGLSSLPTAIIITVNSKLPDKVLSSLPKCGNFKRADTLLT